MSDTSKDLSTASRLNPPYNSTVEEILRMRYGWTAALEPLDRVLSEKTGAINKSLEPLRAERLRLLALSPAELAAAYREEFAREEARQIYNLPTGMADFSHWTLMENWNTEEAAVLLLGRNPDVVKWSKLKGVQYRQSPFVQRLSKLLQIVERADAFQGGRVKPADAWQWAERGQVITPPPELTRWLRARGLIAEAPAEGASEDEGSGSPTKWTSERLAALAAFRAEHGTKQAAEHFGISEARVRKLLPGEPKPSGPNSVFGYRPK